MLPLLLIAPAIVLVASKRESERVRGCDTSEGTVMLVGLSAIAAASLIVGRR